VEEGDLALGNWDLTYGLRLGLWVREWRRDLGAQFLVVVGGLVLLSRFGRLLSLARLCGVGDGEASFRATRQ
jgi:hypothetical protein